MKKTIRLYNLIEFCNNNRNFKLKDVMEEFNISKSTALRDIKDIQELGVPLYSTGGKNGGYKVIRKTHLTRIDLNDEEIKSLYFALSSISNLKSLPFSSEYISIVNKYITVLQKCKNRLLINTKICLNTSMLKSGMNIPMRFLIKL
ncbi:HTH domain-containing protein [Staphylococcus aureus]